VSKLVPVALDLSSERRIHIVGIGGAGMSAIATVLVAMGHSVSGSDLKASSAIERLRSAGVPVELGHRAELVEGADLVAISSAIPARNKEVVAASTRGIPVLSRADVLSAITALRRSIAVAGTHGKTTTSSMLALILAEAGMRPSYVIGGDLNEIGTNALWDSGEWLVVEADESDGTFLRLGAEMAVVTSVEPDHLEHYGSFEALKGAFRSFLAGAGSAIVCADDPVASGLAPPGALTYGLFEGARSVLSGIECTRHAVGFDLSLDGTSLGRFELPVPGVHNALNAAAAVTAALAVGATAEDARSALARFAGVARRFEFRAEVGGVSFVDDYAHLPGEVKAAIDTALRGGFDRVVCVFQPHRYSRVAALAPAFADAFVGADLVVVTEIYGAGEPSRPGVSGQLVVDAIVTAHREATVAYVPGRDDLVGYLRSILEPGDLCLSLAAGDLTNLSDDLASGGLA